MSAYSDVFASDKGQTFRLSVELEFLLSLALLAARDLDKETPPFDEDEDEVLDDYPARLWLSVQGLVVTAASISRLLWPPRDPTGAAQRLRNGLGTAPVLQDRKVRNALEHLDETFHETLEDPAVGDLWTLIAETPEPESDGTDKTDLEADLEVDPLDARRASFRLFNVETYDLEIRTHGRIERLNLRELRVALEGLVASLAAARERHRLISNS